MEPAVPRRRRIPWHALRLPIAVWTLFGCLCASSAFWNVRTHDHSALTIYLYFILVWNGWALATPAITWLARRAPITPFSWPAAAVHGALAVGAAFAHIAWWAVLHVALRPYDDMGAQDVGSALRGDLIDRLFLEGVIYFAVLGVANAVEYRRRLHERELRAAHLEASLAHARLDALELQLQPHFLFNTLHAIGGLVRQQRGSEATEMIAGLSDLLRYSLDHAGKHLVPLAHELAITRRYLEIQACRFSDRLRFSIDEVAPGLGDRLVPAMMLQPLVENAVRHGVEPLAEPGEIAVRAALAGDELVVEVFDTGRGPRAASAAGIGLANLRARLEQLYGGRARFTLAAERGGTVARVELPPP
jgi:two-component system, LytTR family, sensor kinase